MISYQCLTVTYLGLPRAFCEINISVDFSRKPRVLLFNASGLGGGRGSHEISNFVMMVGFKATRWSKEFDDILVTVNLRI